MAHPRWLLARAWRRALTERRAQVRLPKLLRWLREPRISFLLTIRPNRHPLVVFLLTLCAMTGGASLARLLLPGRQNIALSTQSAVEVLPEWQRFLWYTMILIGGLVGVLAALRRDDVESLLTERVALTLLGPASLIWAVVLCTTDLAGEAMITLAFGACCIWRWFRIRRELRAIVSARVAAYKVSEESDGHHLE